MNTLKDVDTLIKRLLEKGTTIELYEDNRRVKIEFLEMIVMSQQNTEKYLQELVDRLLERLN